MTVLLKYINHFVAIMTISLCLMFSWDQIYIYLLAIIRHPWKFIREKFQNEDPSQCMVVIVMHAVILPIAMVRLMTDILTAIMLYNGAHAWHSADWLLIFLGSL